MKDATVKISEWKARKIAKEKAARALGRPLRPKEVVHHIDCNPLNMNNDNLLICTNSYHRGIHNRMRSQAIFKQHKDEIINLYKEGWSSSKIAEKFKIHNAAIRRMLQRNGIKTRNRSKARSVGIRKGLIEQAGCFPMYKKYTRRELVGKLKRASRKIYGRKLTKRRFSELSDVTSGSIQYTFGTWNEAKKIAKIP